MLRLHYGLAGKTILSIRKYFKYSGDPNWLATDLSKKIIKEIDESDVIAPYLIISPVLGPISPERLSEGALGVILMAYDEKQVNCDWIGEYFGDNTLPSILEVSEIVDHDIRMSCAHRFIFPDYFQQGLYLEDSKKVIHSQDEFEEDYLAVGYSIIRNIDPNWD